MLKCITYFFSFSLMLAGLFFIAYFIAAKKETVSGGYYIAVEGREENDSLALQIYSAYIQINLMNFGEKKPVYVIDFNLSEETKASLTNMLEPYGKIIFTDAPQKENEHRNVALIPKL